MNATELPLAQWTDYELRALRLKLEEVLAQDPMPPYTRPREELSKDLADVIWEQDDRARIRRRA